MTGYGIQDCMDYLIKEIIKVTEFKDDKDNGNNEDNIDIEEPRTIRGKKGGCC